MRPTAPQPAAIRSRASSAALKHLFENVRKTYLGLLQLCLRNRIKRSPDSGFQHLSFGLAPYLGQDFFPTVDGGQ